MPKANNKDTRTTPLTSLWYLHHQLRPYPTPHPNARISDPEKINVHWAMKDSRENTPKVKPTEVCQEPNKHSQMYHKQKIIGTQRIQIIIFIIKNYYFIFRSIPNKRQGSESTSVLVEYFKAYFHRVEFSALLKNKNCIKITANINDQQLEWNSELEKAPPNTRNIAQQKTVTIHGLSSKIIINRQ